MASSPGGRSSPQKPVCPSSVSQLQDPGDGWLTRCLSKDISLYNHMQLWLEYSHRVHELRTYFLVLGF